ncbi:HAD-like domain-containing protein [Pelagophyceae sp. CCMP2097]|nr:HAD-like domain-containing protein [Pelagophyceae sp. CCMP2097]|mmetsp:Transcript_11117/g.39115  ORF Transcript_11117/g.39115 Transcript_11117/m.39115 type:complete len:246 (+) Transcript_11117:82-819(+)
MLAPRNLALTRALAFDLDDTLVETSAIDGVAILRAAEFAVEQSSSSLSAEACAAAFAALLGAEPFPPNGAPLRQWREALWRRALQADGAAVDEELAAEAHARWCAGRLAAFRFEPPVAAMLQRLARTYALVLVTNGHADVQRPKLAACGAAAYFGDRILVSGEEPEAKPARSIFDAALRRLGCAANETIMVGDSLSCDVDGALSAGYAAAVWVRRPGQDAAPQPANVFVIENVLELEQLLAGPAP